MSFTFFQLIAFTWYSIYILISIYLNTYLQIFTYLFIFGHAGSLLLRGLSFSCGEWALLFSCSAWASHCGCFSCWGIWTLWHVGFSSCSTWAQWLPLWGSRAQANSCGTQALLHCGTWVQPSSENHQHAVLSQLYCTEKDWNKIHEVLCTLLESGINRQFHPSIKHYFSKLLIMCIHYIYHFKRGSFF